MLEYFWCFGEHFGVFRNILPCFNSTGPGMKGSRSLNQLVTLPAPFTGHCSQHCTALQYTALYCTSLYWTESNCTTLYCTALMCSAVYCSAVQYSAVQCSAVQCSSVQCSTVQYIAVQCIAVHSTECRSLYGLFKTPSIACSLWSVGECIVCRSVSYSGQWNV